MRFASFLAADGVPTWGAVVDGQVTDLGNTGFGLASGLREAIRLGLLDNASERAAEGPSQPADQVEFLPVIPDPGKILCIGLNYRSHLAETGRPAPEHPTVFLRVADSQIGHRRPALMPKGTLFDYEGELAVVIGEPGHRIAEADAMRHVAGYAIYNDLSVRDWQRHSPQWTAGKNFVGTGAFGPYFVPKADVSDVTALTLETRVNGDSRQQAPLSDLLFTIPELIAYLSRFTPLAAGDVVVTGTPGGVGVFMEPRGLLADGDQVEVEITGLGVLHNVVQQTDAP